MGAQRAGAQQRTEHSLNDARERQWLLLLELGKKPLAEDGFDASTSGL